MKTPRKARAVIISDIHFSLPNLELATKALRQAKAYANAYNLPLIIAGDLVDGKSILRAECVNIILTIVDKNTYVIPGNHDLLNEKVSGESALGFLKTRCNLMEYYTEDLGMYFIPYQTSQDALQSIISKIPRGSTIICHQGLKTAFMGHYVQDKTATDPILFDGYRVISGHYHKAQDVKCGKNGEFSYCGSPYSQSWAEADDGLKGFRVLYEDGFLDLVPINSRQHRRINATWTNNQWLSHKINYPLNPKDLIWLTLTGPREKLAELTKIDIERLFDVSYDNCKIEKISTDKFEELVQKDKKTDLEVLEKLLQKMPELHTIALELLSK